MQPRRVVNLVSLSLSAALIATTAAAAERPKSPDTEVAGAQAPSRSTSSRRPVLQIINGSRQTVEVHWLKSEDERVLNGTVEPGRDTVITTTDIFATLASIVGYELPEDAAVDSYDMLPALLGTQEEDKLPIP